MTEFWSGILSGLISGGIVLTLAGAFAAMTWGRLMDKFQAINCNMDRHDSCITDLYKKSTEAGTRLANIEGKFNGVSGGGHKRT